MEILIRVSQLLLSLTILILLHELGHYISAKIFKTKIEKFYLFFNPWFSVFKFKYKDTVYGVGWIPLGGYVKIAGMIDESFDLEYLKREPQPYEFRSKPTWQRFIIIISGVMMNIILAIIIYIVILSIHGEKYLPNEAVKYGIVCDSVAMKLGLQNGDKILKVDNKKIVDFFEIPEKIVLDRASTIQLKRNDSILSIFIPDNWIKDLIQSRTINFISPRIPFIVEGFTEASPGKKAGIKKFDQIIGINDKYYFFFDEFRKAIQEYKNQIVDIIVIRDKKDTLKIPVQVTKEGVIGVYALQNLDYHFDVKIRKYNIFQAIPAGIAKVFAMTVNYFKQLKIIFSPKTGGYESVGGFISIGKIFPAQWDWLSFWSLTAFLSIVLAILNILPIPALDGGHILFVLYEMISGRKPSDKFIEYAQIVGIAIIIFLILYANLNDILQLIKQH